MSWQPIETAPKDGTAILLGSADWDQPDIGRFSVNHAHLREWWADSWQPPSCNPTCWMPLPKLPTGNPFQKYLLINNVESKP